jgi:lysyl-tRNA synthetase class 2
MKESEALFLSVKNDLGLGSTITYRGRRLDLGIPWKTISVEEAFGRYSSLTLDEALDEKRFDEIMVEEIEPRLGLDGPEFIYDYPKSLAALSRLKPGNKEFAERFELYVAGIELANGFSELNDCEQQEDRFRHEQDLRRKLGRPVYPLPEKFLTSLKYLPDAAGIAVGLDRLAMIFTDSAVIDDVVTFTPEEL